MKRTKAVGLAILSSVMLLSSCGSEKEVDYQYNTYIGGSPSTWNVHTWETSSDSIIIGYTETGLYDFVLNEARDGYEIIPEMAASNPVDVSDTLSDAEVVRYGVDDDEGTKWVIDLNQAACWEDGTPINADTYIYSMQQLLSPQMQNYRASSYYADTLQIGNAERYFKSGRRTYEQYSKYVPSDGTDPFYYSFSEANAVIQSISNQMNSIVDFFNEQIPFFENNESARRTFEPFVTFNRVEKTDGDGNDYLGIQDVTCTEDQKGYKRLDRNPIQATQALELLAQLLGASTEAEIDQYFRDLTYCYYSWPELSWDAVGVVKTGEYQITLFLKVSIEEFYLKYNLSGNWLVYEPLYEAGKSTSGNLTVTNYATRLNNYMGYGPYKLSRYQIDKVIVLERNENWYGYSDGKHVGQYQTNKIKMTVITEHSTALQLFLKGELDDVALTAEDMGSFGFSERLLKTPTTYSQKLSFNTDWNALVTRQRSGINKTIYTNYNFRKAFSYAMNRELFAAQYTAGHVPSVVLLNDQYISDYTTSEVYRFTDQGRSVITDLYGSNSNGYSVETANQLFQQAYEEEIANTRSGSLTATDRIEIEILLFNDKSEAAQAQITFMKNCLNEATEGTDLEGKVTIITRKDEDYYNTAYAGRFDCIWSIWGGMTMDPFGFMQVYTSDSVRCEYGFSPESTQLTLSRDKLGTTTDESKTYDEWRKAISAGGEYSRNHEIRLNILAELEKAIINRYETICFTSRAEAELISYKVNFGSDKYIPLIGYGGIREITYNYTAEQWNQVKKTLDYTVGSGD